LAAVSSSDFMLAIKAGTAPAAATIRLGVVFRGGKWKLGLAEQHA
jgi:hypothetical protein